MLALPFEDHCGRTAGVVVREARPGGSASSAVGRGLSAAARRCLAAVVSRASRTRQVSGIA